MKQSNTKEKPTVEKKIPTTADRPLSDVAHKHKLISMRAHELWHLRGCAHGYDVEDWYAAEKEFQDEELLSMDH